MAPMSASVFLLTSLLHKAIVRRGCYITYKIAGERRTSAARFVKLQTLWIFFFVACAVYSCLPGLDQYPGGAPLLDDL